MQQDQKKTSLNTEDRSHTISDAESNREKRISAFVLNSAGLAMILLVFMNTFLLSGDLLIHLIKESSEGEGLIQISNVLPFIYIPLCVAAQGFGLLITSRLVQNYLKDQLIQKIVI